MKSKFTLVQFLIVLLRGSAILIALGVIGMLILIPRASRTVASHHGSIGVFADNGTPSFVMVDDTALTLLPFMNSGFEGALNYDANRPHLLGPEPGNITFGPLWIQGQEPLTYPTSGTQSDSKVIVSKLGGNVTLHHPSNTPEIVRAVEPPLIVAVLCTGLINILILELLCRMLTAVEKDEAFANQTIRCVQGIGLLFVLSGITRLATVGWLKARMVECLMPYLTNTALRLDYSFDGDHSSRIILGCVIVALAQVFRHGLRLKEENSLTI